VQHHGHQHGTGQVLKWSFFATLLFIVVEAFAGIRAGSLALISDAGHNFNGCSFARSRFHRPLSPG